MVRFHLYIWWNLTYLNQVFTWARHALGWTGEVYLSYNFDALSIFGFIGFCFAWFHNTNKGRRYNIELVAGEENQYICYVT